MGPSNIEHRLGRIEARLEALDTTLSNYIEYQSSSEELIAKGFESVRDISVGQVESISGSVEDRFDQFETQLAVALERMSSFSQSGSTFGEESSEVVEQLELQLEKAETERNEAVYNLEGIQKQLRDQQIELDEALESKEAANRSLSYEIEKLVGLRDKNRALRQQLQALKGNIRVMCRIRPAPTDTPREDLVKFGPKEKGEFSDSWGRLFIPVERKTALGNTDVTMKRFDFERIFGPEETNSDVFEEISELVETALDGEKVGVFAYGQTGSGKTHTLSYRDSNDGKNDGIIPKTLVLLFEATERKMAYKYSISMSVTEIYINKTFDLLQEPIEGEKVQTRPEQATFKPLTSLSSADSIIDYALEARATASTDQNATSSRSHLIFTFRIDKEDSEGGIVDPGFLYLVDLAGSERTAKGGAQGAQLEEGIKINNSLMSLNMAITALGKGNSVAFDNDLVRALRPVLSKGSKTLMFVMISPLKKDVQVSIQTLEKGQEASNAQLASAHRGGKPSISSKTTIQTATTRPIRRGGMSTPTSSRPGR